MGYNERPGLVTEFRSTLEIIKQALENERPVELESEDPGRDQYRLRRALKATEVYRNECGGEYAGLGSLVRISTGPGKVIVEPRAGTAIKEVRFSELDVLDFIQQYKGNIHGLQFWPSTKYNEEEFLAQIHSLGFDTPRGIQTREDLDFLEEGQLNVIFTREDDKAPSVMEQLGFKRKV